MQRTTIGLDLAKQVMHAVAVDETGRELWRRRWRRAQLLPALAQIPPARVAMECGSGASHWARQMQRLGHTAKLLAPQHVAPYRSGNKHDFNDARAIAEAAGRASTREVPVKTRAQQELQALHRIRAGYVRQRTALINQWRGLVAEYGHVLPQGVASFLRQAPAVWAALEPEVGATLWQWLGEQLAWLRRVQEQVQALDGQLQRHARRDEAVQRLVRELPGVGVLSATALVARVGDGAQFRRGRDCAAWLGLVPSQHSSAGKCQLGGISKRGDSYLRTLLIHGGRTVVRHARHKDDAFSQWVNALRQRRGENVAAVAVANKNARMAWAVLRQQGAGVAA